MSSVVSAVPRSMRQFWLFHGQKGWRTIGRTPRAHARLQTERAARSACFLTALGRAAVKSWVLTPWPPSGSPALARACTRTLLVLMDSWQCVRKRATRCGGGESRTGTVVFNSLTSGLALRSTAGSSPVDHLLAPMAGGAEEEPARPQRRQFAPVRALLTQVVPAAPLDTSGNSRGQRVWIGAEEPVDMIGLDCQADDLPILLIHDRPDALFQAGTHWSYHHLPAPFGTADAVVDHQVDVGLLVLILHVYSISFFNSARQSERPFIPG
jgi:hypothetical protein